MDNITHLAENVESLVADFRGLTASMNQRVSRLETTARALREASASQAPRDPGDLPEPTPTRSDIEIGWNGLEWGATLDKFQHVFPRATEGRGGRWTTGYGEEPFLGLPMTTRYGFNAAGRLCLIALYPAVADRRRIVPALVKSLGARSFAWTGWRVGPVRVSVTVGGIVVSITHVALASRKLHVTSGQRSSSS